VDSLWEGQATSNIHLVKYALCVSSDPIQRKGEQMVDQPNVILIITDQQRADTMACYGNAEIQTPNLNQLADQSHVLENAYVSQPICTPSRSTILTGLYPHATGCVRNNIPLNAEIHTIADLVPPEYVTAYYGKWHLGDEVKKQHGFDEWVSMEDQYREYYSSDTLLDDLSDYHRYLLDLGYSPDMDDEGKRTFSRELAAALPVEHTKAMFLAEKTSEFIEANKDNPFMICVGLLEPHPPYDSPLSDLYDPEDMTFGEAFLQSPGDDASKLNQSRANEVPTSMATRDDWQKLKAKYWGNVSLVDNAIGKITEALASAGVEDRTVVIFTSEHGDQLGEHHILQKAVLYEESVRVPMIIRVPWLNQNAGTVQGRFGMVDLVPTMLDLIGAPIPDHLHGQSRLKVLEGKENLADNDVVVEWNGRNLKPSNKGEEIDRIQNSWKRSLITADGWKFNVSVDDRCELFDLNSDPSELINLIDSDDQRERKASFLGELKTWQKTVDDEMVLPAISDI
jgi:arylsulfatase A-like enzyme